LTLVKKENQFKWQQLVKNIMSNMKRVSFQKKFLSQNTSKLHTLNSGDFAELRHYMSPQAPAGTFQSGGPALKIL